MKEDEFMDYKLINSVPSEDIEYILYMIKNDLLDRLKLLGSGAGGEVYEYKNYAIKYAEEGIRDGEILEKFQDNPLFLKLYFYGDEFMVTEKIDIIDAFEYYDRDIEVDFTAEEFFKLCESKGYMPYDLHDSNVIVSNDELKIIDVGAFCNLENHGINFLEMERNREIERLSSIIWHVKMPPIAI
jgi:hypothetical protein